MIITNIESTRSVGQIRQSSDRRSSLFKAFVLGSMSLALVACGGDESTNTTSVAGVDSKPKALVTGQSLVGLGPLSVANLATFEANGNGVVSPSAVAISTSSTETDGAFEILVPVDHAGLQIASFGGIYIDRTDQAQDGSPPREITLGSTDTAVQAWLPAGEEVVVLNLLTEALYIKSLGESSGGNFDQIFQANRDKATESIGFDIVSTVPSIPVNPAVGDDTASKQYGMFLGGLANAVNAVSVKLDLAAANADVLRAIALDLTDGDLDGAIRGVTITTALGNLPTDVDLASEIIRFRNNNFEKYESVSLVEFSGADFGSPTVVNNAAPVATNDQLVVFRGQPTVVGAGNGVLINDTDPEGNPLQAILQTQPTGASVALESDGGFTLTLTNNDLGIREFTYVANDLSLDSPPATVALDIQNLAPTVVNDNASVNEGDSVTVAVLNNDSDEIPGLSILSVGAAQNGAVSIVGNSIQYLHDGSETLSDSFDYRVSDVDGAEATAAVQITILPVNDAPQVVQPLGTAVATEGQPFVLSLNPNDIVDPENSVLSYSAISDNGQSLPAWLSFDAAALRFSGTPDDQDLPGAAIRVTADDGNGGTVSDVLNIAINSVNDAPSLSAPSDVSATEDDNIVPIAISVDDPESGAAAVVLTASSSNQFLVQDQNLNISGSGTSRTLNLVLEPNANGITTITLSADDGNGGVSTQSFTVSVAAVNDAPIFTSTVADQTADEDTAVGPLAFSYDDVETSAASLILTISSSNQTVIADGSISIGGTAGSRTLSYSPVANANGSAEITITVSDGVNSVSDTFTATVDAVNDAPSFVTGGDENINEDAGAQVVADKLTVISAGPADESSQTVSFTVTNDNNALFSAQPSIDASGQLSYTAAAETSGSATISIVALDNGSPVASSAIQTFVINVSAINDAPSFVLGGNEVGNEDAGAQVVAAKASAISAGPADESSQTVSFTVSNDNNSLFSAQPAIDANGQLSYQAAADANGSAVVTVVALDNGSPAASSPSQTFTITVNAVNDAPSFTLSGDETSFEDGGTEIFGNKVTALIAGPANESGQAVNLLVTNDNNALFSAQPVIDAQGALIYVAAPDASGTATVSVTAQDDGGTANGGAGTSITQTFTITVAAVNDAPSFSLSGDETSLEDGGTEIFGNKVTALIAGPADESDQSVNLIVTNDNNALFSAQPVIDAQGALIYVAAPDANGSAVVSVSAQDDGGAANGGADTSATQTFTITITAVNDQPSFVLGGDETSFEDGGTEIFGNKVTALIAGPANESGQAVNLLVTNDNNALFSAQPVIDAQGALIYVAAADASGTATVSVSAQDDGGTANSGADTSPTQTFVITVISVNDAPSFILGGNETVNEDSGPQTVAGKASSISAGPSDESTQNVSFTVSNDNNGLFAVEPVIDASGQLSYTPANETSGIAAVTVTAVDNGSPAASSASQTFSITVNPVNDAPVIVTNNGLTLNESAVAPIDNTLLTASDSDNTITDITFTVTTLPLNGEVQLSGVALGLNGTFTVDDIDQGLVGYNHFGGENVSDTFSFSLTDPDGAGPTGQAFNVTVNPVNDAPVISANNGLTLIEGAVSPIDNTLLTASDDDNAITDITFTVTTLPVNGEVQLSGVALGLNGTFTVDDIDQGLVGYNHFGGEDTSDSVGFSVTDLDGAGPTGQIFSITVNPVNDAPVIVTNNGLTVNEDAVAPIDNTLLTASDADNAITDITFTVTTLPLNGEVQLSGVALGLNGTFSVDDIDQGLVGYNHLGGENVSDSFGFSLTDPDGAGPTGQTFAITVNPVNDAPVIVTNNGLTVNEGAIAQIGNTLLTASDDDNATTDITFTVTTLPVNGEVQLSGVALGLNGTFTVDDIDQGRVDYNHFGGENTGDSFGFSLTDPDGDGPVGETFAITVNPVNDAPVIVTNNGLTLNEGAVAPIDNTLLVANDLDNGINELTFTVTALPVNGEVQVSGVALSVNGTFTMLDVDNGLVDYNHFGGENVSDTFTFSLTDTDGAGPTGQTFAIAVNPVNDAPVIVTNNGLTLNEGAVSPIDNTLLTASDNDNAITDITFTITTLPVNGEVQLSGVALGLNGTFTVDDIDQGLLDYNHFGGEDTSDSFGFSLTDSDSAGPTGQAFNITVNPVNDAPVISTNNGLTLNEGAVAPIDNTLLTASDSDNAIADVTFTVTTLPLNGEVQLSGVGLGLNGTFSVDDIDQGRVGYNHFGGENVSDTFTFSLTDADGAGPTGETFSITVTPVNDAPVVVTNNGLTLNEGAVAPIDNTLLTASDSDNAITDITFTITTLPLNGEVQLSGVALGLNGTFTVDDTDQGLVGYNHFGGEDTSDSVGFSVTDLDGAGPTGQIFSITVNPVNDAPVIVTNNGLTLDEGTVASIDNTLLVSNDLDNTTNELTFTVTALPGNGEVQLSGVALVLNGTFTMADVDGGLVAYSHFGGENVSDTFTFSLTDLDGAGPTGETFAISVNPVNDAPVIDPIADDSNDEDGNPSPVFFNLTDADTATASVTTSATSSNQALVQDSSIAIIGTGTSRQLAYSLEPDQSGSTVITVTADDGAAQDSETFTLVVNPVNDEPSFTVGVDILINAASTAQNVAGHLSAISAGPADEASQTVSFTVTNDNNALFDAQPSIDAAGQLSYDPGAVGGVATVSVTAVDDGGTANGGADTSTVQTFDIVVNSLPVVDTNTGLFVGAGVITPITSDEFSVSDLESGTDVTHTAVAPACGDFLLSGSVVSVFTQDDILAGIVDFRSVGCPVGIGMTVSISSADPQGASISNLFAISVGSVAPVTFSPALNAVNVGSGDVVITNFENEATNPADLSIGSGASGTFMHRQMSGAAPSINDSSIGELSITPGANFHANETVSVTYSNQIQDTRGIGNSKYVQQFRAATFGPGDGNLVQRPAQEFGLGVAREPLGIDVDNDGDLDAVFGELVDGVWLNDGAGNFSVHPSGTNLGTGTFNMTAADMNNDGAIDVLRTTFGDVQVWLNNGSGTFSLFSSHSIPAPIAVIAGDIDADGDLDVVVSPSGFVTEDGYVFENDGTGTIAPHSTPNFGSNRNISDVQFADFDNDGDLDIYSASSDTHNIWSNDGTGVFTRTQFITSQNNSQARIADLDGDGFQDVILVVRQGGSNAIGDIRVLINDGAGQLVMGAEQDIGDFQLAQIGDMDSDGDIDLVVMRGLELHVAINDGANNFTLQADANTSGNSYADFALFDIDGDGDLDTLLSTAFASRQQNIWLNNTAPVASLDNSTVNENVANEIVGVLSATLDPGETESYVFVAGAGDIDNGSFAITITPGGIYHLRVAASPLDFEAKSNYSVRIQVSDGAGGVNEQAFAVTANDVNDAPVVDVNNPLTVAEGAIGPITSALLSSSDQDAAHGATDITYTITTLPVNGEVQLSGVGLGLNGTFTVDDIDQGLVGYNHFGGENVSDSFGFSLTDPDSAGPTGQSFSITITPVNDAPVIVTNNGLTLNEGAVAPIDNTLLTASDNDNAITDITFTVTTLPVNGEVQLSGVALGLNGTFTVDDIDQGLVGYNHFGGENVSDSFTFSLTDPDGDGPTGQSFNITVNPVNDAPVITALNDLTLDENVGAGIPNTLLRSVDVDNTPAEITFTITTAVSNGELRVNSVPIEVNGTFTQEDIDNGLLFYQHDGGETVSDTFTVSILDPDAAGLTGINFNIVVNPINDAPSVTLGTAVFEAALATSIDLVPAIGSGGLVFADADAGAADVQLTITASAPATITVNDTGLLVGKVTNNGTSSVQITAPIADINTTVDAAAGVLVSPGGLGTFNLDFAIDDLGNVGASGPLQDSAALELRVNTIPLADLDGVNGVTLESASAGIKLGYSLTDVGDINADGFSDFAVAASDLNRNPVNQSDFNADGLDDGLSNGAVYVIYGNTSAVVHGFDLDTLDGTNGFVIQGAQGTGDSNHVDTRLGSSLASAGDFNGDGIVDLIFGSGESTGSGPQTGRTYVVFGEAGRAAAAIDLSSEDSTQWVAFDGQPLSRSGSTVASGDFNSDGFSDIAIGAQGENSDTGAVYLVFGSHLYGPGSGTSFVDLSTITTDLGVGIRFESDTSLDQFGKALAMGDVYGDGGDALLIGSNLQAVGNLGGFYVVRNAFAYQSATTLGAIPLGDGTRIAGTGNIDGFSLDVVDDMNGDGIADIVFGTADTGADGTENAGWIVPGFGPVTPAADLSITDASLNAIELIGSIEGDNTGVNVSTVGDFNADGFGDLLISAATADAETGKAYLVFGAGTLTGPTIDLAALDGSTGVTFVGVAAGDQAGSSPIVGMAVSAAGDVNGDGFDDILIGATAATHAAGVASGNAYLVYGSPISNNLPLIDASIGELGTGAADLVVGGLGADTLNGSADSDILIGGPGDDILIYDAGDNIRVDGGLGDDTLQVPDFGGSVTVRFEDIEAAASYALFQNIETIQLPDANRPDVYSFDEAAVRNMTDERNVLRVFGDITLPTAPRVQTADSWLSGPVVTEGPVTYNSYKSTSSEVYLYVDQRLTQSSVQVTTLAKRASQSTSGVEANSANENAKISGNGLFVVYQSTADNLDPLVSTTPGRQHIYRTDLLTNETIMVSQSSGLEADDFSYDPCISYDGARISFATNADNLVGTVVEEQLLVEVVGSNVASPISLNVGASSTGECDISADGNFVGYYSDDEILRYDIAGGQNLLVSTDITGLDVCSSTDICGGVALSGDGSLAVFTTPVNLPALSDGNTGHDIILANLNNGDRTLVTSGRDGQSTRPDISADGNRIVFESDATNVTGFDSNGAPDIFIYEVAGNIFGRASTNDTGGATSVPTGITISPVPDGAGDPAISGDGEFIAWLGNQVGFSLPDTNVSVYLKHVSGAINNSVLVGEADRYHHERFDLVFDAPSDRVSIDFTGLRFSFQSTATNVVRGDSNQLIDTNGVSDVFAANNPIFVENLVANSDGDALTNSTEIALGTNPGASDSDFDGLSDFEEVNRDGDPTTLNVVALGDSDPLKGDTDGDGLGDAEEVTFGGDPSAFNSALYVSQSSGNDANSGTGWGNALQTNSVGVGVNSSYLAGGVAGTPLYVLYEAGVYDELPAGGSNVVFVGGMSANNTRPISSMATAFESNRFLQTVAEFDAQTGIGIESVSFRHAGGGSGRAISFANGSVALVRNSIVAESLPGTGGGVRLSNGAAVTFDNVTFAGNVASLSETGASNGGALQIQTSAATVLNSRFESNRVVGDGALNNGNGGAIYAGPSSTLIVKNSVFIGNATDTSELTEFSGGGAISTLQAANVTIEDSQFQANATDGFGGALRISDIRGGGSLISVSNNMFVANLADDASGTSLGGAAFIVDANNADVRSNTFAYNQTAPVGPPSGGGGIVFFGSGLFNSPPGPPIYNFFNNIAYFNVDIDTSSTETANINVGGSVTAANLDRQFNNVLSNTDADDIDSDPIFTHGVYLGNQAGNLSVDAGDAPAASYLLNAPYTTAISGQGDSGTVDLGYHYQQGDQRQVATLSPSTTIGNCTGPLDLEFSALEIGGAEVGEGRIVAALLTASDPSLSTVTLAGVGTIEPAGAGSVLLKALPNGRYMLTITTTADPQLGNLTLELYEGDMSSAVGTVVINYPGPC